MRCTQRHIDELPVTLHYEKLRADLADNDDAREAQLIESRENVALTTCRRPVRWSAAITHRQKAGPRAAARLTCERGRGEAAGEAAAGVGDGAAEGDAEGSRAEVGIPLG